MRELTEQQKKQMDDIFYEPLSDRGKKPPKDYNPPVKGKDEDIKEYLKRLDNYNLQFYADKKHI